MRVCGLLIKIYADKNVLYFKILRKGTIIMTKELKDKIVEINKEKSIEIQKLYSSLLQPNECYTNAFHIYSKLLRKWDNEKDKIVYGYIIAPESKEYLDAMRHAWIYYKGEHIEITPKALERSKDYHYVPFKYLDAFQYYDLIEENNGYPSLDKQLKKDEDIIENILKENGYHTDNDFLDRLGMTVDEFNALSDQEKLIIKIREIYGANN